MRQQDITGHKRSCQCSPDSGSPPGVTLPWGTHAVVAAAVVRVHMCVCVRVRMCVRAYACVRACAYVCVRACAHACHCMVQKSREFRIENQTVLLKILPTFLLKSIQYGRDGFLWQFP